MTNIFDRVLAKPAKPECGGSQDTVRISGWAERVRCPVCHKQFAVSQAKQAVHATSMTLPRHKPAK